MYDKKKKYTILKLISILVLGYCLYYTSNDWYHYAKDGYKSGFNETEVKDSISIIDPKIDSLIIENTNLKNTHKSILDSINLEISKNYYMYKYKLDSLILENKSLNIK